MGVARTGILGGAFDPPHDGHVALARAAIAHFAARPPARARRRGPRAQAGRGERSRPARAGARSRSPAIPGAEVALDPFARTVDSLEALGLDDPVFLVGADEFASFLELEAARARARAGAARRRHEARLSARSVLDEVLAQLAHPRSRRALRARAVPGLVVRDPRAGRARASRSTGSSPPRVAAEIERRGLYRPRAGLH